MLNWPVKHVHFLNTPTDESAPTHRDCHPTMFRFELLCQVTVYQLKMKGNKLRFELLCQVTVYQLKMKGNKLRFELLCQVTVGYSEEVST